MDLKEFHAASDYKITRDNCFSMEGQFTKKKLNTSTITENKRHFFIWTDNVQLFLFILAQSQREGENQKITKDKGQFFIYARTNNKNQMFSNSAGTDPVR